MVQGNKHVLEQVGAVGSRRVDAVGRVEAHARESAECHLLQAGRQTGGREAVAVGRGWGGVLAGLEHQFCPPRPPMIFRTCNRLQYAQSRNRHSPRRIHTLCSVEHSEAE